MEPAAVEYRTTRGRMALYALGSLGFVALGLWLAFLPDADVVGRGIGWFCAAFFGLCFVGYVFQTVRPRIVLRLDESGVHCRQPIGAMGFDLPWRELADVKVVWINRQPLVVFVPHDPEWGLAHASPATRPIVAANRALVGSWMTVAPRLFGVKPETLVAEAERRRRAALPDAAVEHPRPLYSQA